MALPHKGRARLLPSRMGVPAQTVARCVREGMLGFGFWLLTSQCAGGSQHIQPNTIDRLIQAFRRSRSGLLFPWKVCARDKAFRR